MNNVTQSKIRLENLQTVTESFWRVEIRHNDQCGFQIMFYCEDDSSEHYGKELHTDNEYNEFINKQIRNLKKTNKEIK